MKLGLKPFTPDKRDLRFSAYLTGEPLPQHPAVWGHEDLVTSWGMLGNDNFGDCVWAGAAHETMLWNAMAGRTVTFTDDRVLEDYAAVTGFKPNDPTTDNGTDLREAAKYRQKTGILDADGNRHRIGAYVFIEPDNYENFLTAMWLFGSVGIAINFPGSAMQQFNAGQPWSVVPGSNLEGGHYVPVIADRAMPQIVTWGRVQAMMARFWRTYCTSIVVYVSEEMLTSGKSLDGFDLATLQQDLAAVSRAP